MTYKRSICHSFAAIAAIALGGCLAGCNQTVTPPAQATEAAAREDHQHAGDAHPADPPAAESEPAASDATYSTSLSATSLPTAASGTVEVKNASVEAMDVVKVPAQDAGVIRVLNVSEGDSVTEGDIIGKIDDDRPQIELQLAKIERATSKEQAENKVNLNYAIAAERVAEIEHRKALEANRNSPGTFPEVEIERLRLVHTRSKYQVEQARMEQKIAGMTHSANESRVVAAEKAVARRVIRAPLTGVVVDINRRATEWADPGDPVLEVIRSDRMRVTGYMNAAEHDPHTVAGKPVRVSVELARGRKIEFDGVIKLPSLSIERGKYFVWAIVENKKEGSAWLLRPGQRATMTIDVK